MEPQAIAKGKGKGKVPVKAKSGSNGKLGPNKSNSGEIHHIKDLLPDPKNARRHTPRNVGIIVSALQEVGTARSGVIDEKGRVLAGNATLEALGQAGIERVKVVDAKGDEWVVVRRTGLTAKQKTRLALYDNRTSELSEWDVGVLNEFKSDDLLAGLFADDEWKALAGEANPPDEFKSYGEDIQKLTASAPNAATNIRMAKQQIVSNQDKSLCSKPPYCIPSMVEIAAVRKNGYKVVSTFSGCGGTCLGFKMAGFDVLWANEFIPAAREVYAMNHLDTILDAEDIRMVKPERILAAIKMKRGEIDVLEGSPPCAAFSTAGKRSEHWNQIRKYSDTKQRTDDLFFEFARVLEGLQPKVFVAENVSGLVKGVAKGYFKEILQALKICGYKVEAKLLDAQWLGAPQMRQRIIFMGVRNDICVAPRFPKPFQYRYSLKDIFPYINKQGDNGGFSYGKMRLTNKPSPTIGTGVQTGNGLFPPSLIETNSGEKRKLFIAELKQICSFPADFKMSGNYAKDWERLGRSVPPLMAKAIALSVKEVLDEIAQIGGRIRKETVGRLCGL